MLANQISERYHDQPCAVVALCDGGVMVGAQIAMRLHASLGMLLTEEIDLPRELIAIGGLSMDGTFTYNHAFSSGEIEELASEYRGIIEQEKLEKLHEMHRTLGTGSLIQRNLLVGHHVILVSDGLVSGLSIDLALEYLKPIPMRKLIVATPLASVKSVDRIHVLADDIFCLSVVENYISTEHYYDTQDVPEHDVIIQTIEHITRNWQ